MFSVSILTSLDTVESVVQILAVVVTGPLLGVEFGVTGFSHPILERLPDEAYRFARGASSRILGKAMPFWYGLALLMELVAAVLWREPLVIAAVVLMVVIVILTLTTLLPLNNRLAVGSGDVAVLRESARRWDRWHWTRVGLLTVSFVMLAVASIP